MSFIGSALAQSSESAAAQQPPAFMSMIENMFPLLLIFVMMYFVMIRPQAKKAKEQAELLKNLKAGDEIVTSGGIIGRIRSVADEFVTIDISSAQLKVLKEHVTRLTKPQGDRASKQAKVPAGAKR
ncbi:MAG: preprotein translocase subunit YajC [Oligoflexales bacterium]|nr:preprotein translocase subunit YajC [Oligoflexales bacterium]